MRTCICCHFTLKVRLGPHDTWDEMNLIHSWKIAMTRFEDELKIRRLDLGTRMRHQILRSERWHFRTSSNMETGWWRTSMNLPLMGIPVPLGLTWSAKCPIDMKSLLPKKPGYNNVAHIARPINCSICFLEARVWEISESVKPNNRMRLYSGNVIIPVAALIPNLSTLTSVDNSHFSSSMECWWPDTKVKGEMLWVATKMLSWMKNKSSA